ncbi:MAG: helix-turn-helix domain-containing protein [Oscillospiraceae bacterium]|nr:helix-turn-helix domain-containing protein [Oscillospiraceae bacterium]
MNNELLGAQIAKYRKAAGITQEELGKTVGVSTQAVSRWECGGAPDVSLLPNLADKLGVTIDTLFGRSEGKAQDIYEVFTNWLASMPLSQRMEQVFRLVAATQCFLLEGRNRDGITAEDLKRSTTPSAYTDEGHLIRAAYALREGITLAVPAEECPFYLLMPEPEGGYEPNLLSPEKYRELFEILGRLGSMEILIYLHRRHLQYFTVNALARHAGLDHREAEPLLRDMAKINLLKAQTIESERGMESIYAWDAAYGFIPFLFMARWIIDPSDSWRGIWTNRDKPILSPEPVKEEPKV